MQTDDLPNVDEVALGCFLEDIGKFMQRAHGSSRDLPEHVRSLEIPLLPLDGHGGYSHKHVLWTEAFFQSLEAQRSRLPAGLDLGRVRNMAVFHHAPDHHPVPALGWLSAKADRLSAGMDRKERDAAQEDERKSAAWDAYKKAVLRSVFADVELRCEVPRRPSCYAVDELTPETIVASAGPVEGQPGRYADLWPRFFDEFASLCRDAPSTNLLHEGVLGLSERFTWAIPSSTVDQPDVPLHDHNRTVAAIGACLFLHHSNAGDLLDPAAIKDDTRPKFRLLVGDLSGIQHSLFLLRNQQVRGVNRILRARSFLLGALVETAALLCRERFGVPAYCLLQQAGGRFDLLLPDVPGQSERLEALRGEIDRWIVDRYSGELALNLALTPPFPPIDLALGNFVRLWERVTLAAEEAKQRPAGTVATGVLRVDEYGANGACAACGLRPATEPDERDGETVWRCMACHDEERIGAFLPKAGAVLWFRDGTHGSGIGLPGGLRLRVLPYGEPTERVGSPVSGYRLAGPYAGDDRRVRLRHVANRVPIMGFSDDSDRYRDVEQTIKVGDLKTFEHLGRDALERVDGMWLGKPHLAVIKADVDHLGQVFAVGLEREGGTGASVGRIAALSRMMDAFFTARLDRVLSGHAPGAYTVYAGGDDLLLIAPWFEGIEFLKTLRHEFRDYVGGNSNLTISAGLEIVHVDEPLNRAVLRADERLKRAKNQGRNRVCLIDEASIPWDSLEEALREAGWLNDQVRAGLLPSAFLYKMLSLENDRRRAEDAECPDPAAAPWRARWGYHLARQLDRLEDRARRDEFARRLNALMGLSADLMQAGGMPSDRPILARIAITIALYRNR